ncbi:LysR family transcriptional regulator [Lentilitoribacter sp. Alg239-R112]|uniref:LysR family transcriptional regulator n=1 Tax=Lentilitoribacter sp. Alg239-R112 TaxID=2305987 RepID=UPI0013A6A5F9|nr:LysR family transcriptional regulator [Lentilitoribacter sp. Alg239-R112]
MAYYFKNLDWSLIQSFIAVAEHGSLTGGAHHLGKSQPTLGRDIAKIETALKTQLFTRERHGLSLTDQGVQLLKIAKEMHISAAKLITLALDEKDELSGTVRITASLVMSNFILPEIIAKLRSKFPNIELELHASDESENLLFHEADIAIRMYRPDQLDIITRHVGDTEIGIFASKNYITRNGIPKSMTELMEHDWIGYDRSELMIKGMRALGWQVDRSFFKVRCDDQAAYWHLLKAGAGIGVGQVVIAQQSDNLVRLFDEIDIPPIPIWLTANKALKQSARIRAIYDAIAKELSKVTKR